jgi:hypothetical protein
MEYNNNPQENPNYEILGKDNKLIVNYIVLKVEKGTGLSLQELKIKYTEERFFYEALKYVTTTKKALCKALNINIDNACRYKREFEIHGDLMQSTDEVYCPYTGFMAHLISTNPDEFEKLKKSKTNQLKMF